ncbi:unnamed protein product [Phytophthora fragariaefolia]|uniref:Unnamed protein product n=1 Tax=Phytophthora fragariaefolia TaxID=1490495 RepID=A0A9W6XPR5_9STRA|nr:unnamed protein product [Phytophthora fragariaefolia]
MVNAIDDYGAQPGPYVFMKDADSEEEHKDDEDPESKVGSKDTPFDFSQDPSPPSTPRSSRSSGISHGGLGQAAPVFAVGEFGLGLHGCVQARHQGQCRAHPVSRPRAHDELVRVMYWGKLDQTPWSKYVPSWYCKKSESHLEKLHAHPNDDPQPRNPAWTSPQI